MVHWHTTCFFTVLSAFRGHRLRVARGAAGGRAPHASTASRAASFTCRESTRHPAMAACLIHHIPACIPHLPCGSLLDRITQAWRRARCSWHDPGRDGGRRAAATRQRSRAHSAAPRSAAVLPAVGALGTFVVAAQLLPFAVCCKATARRPLCARKPFLALSVASRVPGPRLVRDALRCGAWEERGAREHARQKGWGRMAFT